MPRSTPLKGNQTVIVGILRNMFTRNDCIHQESILSYDFKSSGGIKSKCVPTENEQMALFSCAMNNFFCTDTSTENLHPVTSLKKKSWMGWGGRKRLSDMNDSEIL